MLRPGGNLELRALHDQGVIKQMDRLMAGRAELVWQSRKGCGGVSLWQEGVFLDYSEDSLPPLPQCWVMLWTAADQQSEIKHINYLRCPLAPFFLGAWCSSHWVGERFCLV